MTKFISKFHMHEVHAFSSVHSFCHSSKYILFHCFLQCRMWRI